MLTLKRGLYHFILHLHPAAFRNRFGDEMSLDFEDALATYGFPRLLLDATRSLLRQWTIIPSFATRTTHTAIPLHPLLAGQYFAIDDDNLKLIELARGSFLFMVLAFAIGLAFNAGGRRAIPALQHGLPASHDGGVGIHTVHPSLSASEAGPGHHEAEPDYTQLLMVPAPDNYSQNLPPARLHNGHLLVVSPHARIQRIRVESWTEFLTRCALVTLIVWLTSLSLRRTRAIPVRAILIAIGLLGITLSAVASPIRLQPVRAQLLQADGPLPSYEVATVKLRDPNTRLLLTPPGSQQLVTQAGTAKTLISAAYQVRPNRIISGPAWIDDSHNVYVVECKIPQELFARMQSMTGDQRHNQASLMLQSLLAARFGLKTHVESHEMPVYELTLAKGGAKLPAPNDETPSSAGPGSNAAQRPPQMGGGEQITKDGVKIRNMTLDGMLDPPWFDLGDRPVLNKTGLTGKYNLTINWLPNIAAQGGPGTEITAPEGQASIFTALEEQFGLKLVPAKASVEVLVIDFIDKPTEN